MKVVILAGGKGTRLQDHTNDLIPKPMVEIGGEPILWHIIKNFWDQGFSEFIIAAGHRWEVIDRWFAFNRGRFPIGMNIDVRNTGESTQTGGRIKKLREDLSDPFIVTYGDGLADVNYYLLLDHHHRMSKSLDPIVTLTAANPPSRFGNLQIVDGRCSIFTEKGQDPQGWINAGFYVCDAAIAETIPGDSCIWEKDILPALALQGRLAAYQHPGEFQMVDTWRDLKHLEDIYKTGEPFWERYAHAS